MAAETTRRHESFIVRIWQEPGGPLGWRGQVMKVSSQRVDSFEDFDGLVAVFRRYMWLILR